MCSEAKLAGRAKARAGAGGHLAHLWPLALEVQGEEGLGKDGAFVLCMCCAVSRPSRLLAWGSMGPSLGRGTEKPLAHRKGVRS